MHAGAIVLGVAMVLGGLAMIRWRSPLAEWAIANRINALRLSSLANRDYVDRQADALSTRDSKRLSRWMTAAIGACITAMGLYAVVKGAVGY